MPPALVVLSLVPLEGLRTFITLYPSLPLEGFQPSSLYLIELYTYKTVTLLV
jgi:hypothetical protein